MSDNVVVSSSGIESAMFGIAVTQAVYYYWYEFVKGVLEERSAKKNLTIAENMLSGALAGAATSILTNPIWVLNTRLLVTSKENDEAGKVAKKPSTWEAAMKIYNEEGLAGFFKGLLPALVLVINPVIQYTVFERMKLWLEKRKPTLSGIDFFFLGAVSKLCATSITYPYM